MRVFVAASYSSKVNYVSGEVYADYRNWMEDQLDAIEAEGHEVFNSLRKDDYKINNDDPAQAFLTDFDELDRSDVLVAFVSDQVSAGVQVEIGYAIAKSLRIILVQMAGSEPSWSNAALDKANLLEIVTEPFDPKVI